MDKEQKRRFSALSGSIKRTDKEVDRLFNRAVAQVVALIQSLGISLDGIPDGDRFLQIHPEIDRGIRRITNDLAGDLLQSMEVGILDGWDLAQDHADDLLTAYVGNYTPAQQNLLRSSLLSRREGASMEFLRSRLEDRVSGSVWQTSEQARRHITSSVASALEEGVSADDLSRWIRNDLREPNRLFRRVRDKKSGKLRLSAPAKAYHPGQGVYRSSYKNAKRLARTEINIAYRSSDYDRWQDKDFVLGIKVQLSNNHTCNGVPFTDICDDLQGVYPKDFKFTGWHPQCRCIATPILEDRQHYLERRLHGKGEAPEPVRELPPNFSKWMEENKDRLEPARQKGTLPYFVKDNEKALGFDKSNSQRKVPERRKRRTEEQVKEIQERWDCRTVTNAVNKANEEAGGAWLKHPDAKEFTIRADARDNLNGYTFKDGRIFLSPDRVAKCASAVRRIKGGAWSAVTKSEADAMATLWHEITHNKNPLEFSKLTDRCRRRMELANEYVARRTLGDFYKRLGAEGVPHKIFMYKRAMGYDGMVRSFRYAVRRLGLDEGKVFDAMSDRLFSTPYHRLNDIVKRTLSKAGADKIRPKIVMEDGTVVEGAPIGKRLVGVIADFCSAKDVSPYWMRKLLDKIGV